MRDTGKSGFMGVDAGNQEILERPAVVVTEDYLEVRFTAGLRAPVVLGGKVTGIDPRRGSRDKVQTKSLASIAFGRQTIDLAAVEQIAENPAGQNRGNFGTIFTYANRAVCMAENG